MGKEAISPSAILKEGIKFGMFYSKDTSRSSQRSSKKQHQSIYMSHINLFPLFGYLSIYLPCLNLHWKSCYLCLNLHWKSLAHACLIQDRFAILAKQNGFTGLERVGERLSDECSLESVICGCRRSYDKIRALVRELSVRREE